MDQAIISAMQKQILVVDDNDHITSLVKMMLPYKGFHVLTASTGAGTMDALQANPAIQLVLMDMQLCGEHGPDIATLIKSNPIYSHIPVLLMSAHADGLQFAIDGSVDGFIEKPFGLDEMIDKINALLISPVSKV